MISPNALKTTASHRFMAARKNRVASIAYLIRTLRLSATLSNSLVLRRVHFYTASVPSRESPRRNRRRLASRIRMSVLTVFFSIEEGYIILARSTFESADESSITWISLLSTGKEDGDLFGRQDSSSGTRGRRATAVPEQKCLCRRRRLQPSEKYRSFSSAD